MQPIFYKPGELRNYKEEGPSSAIQRFRKRLPIYSCRREFLYAVETHQVVVLIGEPGCGRSTQIPQYLYESGWCQDGKKIGVCFPNRLSVLSIAKRVAYELNTNIGEIVGYAIRYETKTQLHTSIKFTTDGTLLREIMLDPLLTDYSIIIIDDAHERGLNTDILLGVLKKILKKRPNLRVVICSTAYDASSLQLFFKKKYEADNKVPLELTKESHKSMQKETLKEPMLQKKLCQFESKEKISQNNASFSSESKYITSRGTIHMHDTVARNDRYLTENGYLKNEDGMLSAFGNLASNTNVNNEFYPKTIMEPAKRMRKENKNDCSGWEKLSKKDFHKSSNLTDLNSSFEIETQSNEVTTESRMLTNLNDKISLSGSTVNVKNDGSQLVNQSFLKDVCTLVVEGRQYKVDIFYLKEPCRNYLLSAIDTVAQIHKSEPQGDILVFLTGQGEINNAIQLLQKFSDDLDSHGNKSLKLLPIPLYADLAYSRLDVFQHYQKNTRRVIISTNVAENSITINNIVYIIDCGFTKIRVTDFKTGIDYLNVVTESRDSAAQRTGRAGRSSPGKCFRLMTQSAFYSSLIPQRTVPDIMKCNMVNAVLYLKSIGADNVLNFEFLSTPSTQALEHALEFLFAVEAIDEYTKLTEPLGIIMAELQLPPGFTRLLVLGGMEKYGCSEEAATMVAMLSSPSPWLSCSSKKKLSACKRSFAVREGDFITQFNVYMQAMLHQKEDPNWAKRHLLDSKIISSAENLRSNLIKDLKALKIPMLSCGSNIDALLKLICAAFFINAAQRQKDGSYLLVRCAGIQDAPRIMIDITSVLHAIQPEWIVFSEAVVTEDVAYARSVSSIDPRKVKAFACTTKSSLY